MIVKLKEIAQVKAGNSAPKKDSFSNTGIPFIRAGSLEFLVRNHSIEQCEKIGEIEAKNSKLKLFPKGSILFAKSGMSAKMGRVYQLSIDAFVVSHLAAIIPNETIVSSSFLKYYFLRKPPFNLIRDEAYPSIRLTDIENIEIDLPDLENQNKIVAILDKANALVQKRQQTIDLLDELLRAQFLETIGNPTSSEKFNLTTLSTYLEKVQIGPFGSQLHRADYVSNEIPLINPINIVDNKIMPDFEVTIRKSKYESLPNYHLKTGDLIMARRGEMGRCGIITETENGWFCGTGSLYLRPKDTKRAMFLLHCISNRATVEYLNHNAKGVTMKNLNKSIIANIPIVDCPEEIILQFNALVEKYDTIRSRTIDNLQQIENLFYSILQRAFSGKLYLDVSVELDALLEGIDLQKPENDLFSISTNEEYLLSLVRRLNNQEFESQELYDKAKHTAFQLLKEEERLAQEYDEESKSLKLVVK